MRIRLSKRRKLRPGGYRLSDYQWRTLRFLFLYDGAVQADGTALGVHGEHLACSPRTTEWLAREGFTADGRISDKGRAAIGLRSSFTHRGYLDVVQRVREYIIAGDIFQANISQRLEAPLREAPWSLYTRLRALNPAPFAAARTARIMLASPAAHR